MVKWIWCSTFMKVSTTSTNPLQLAVTIACTVIWGRIKSEAISSSTSLACPWQLASNRASSQAGWYAPAFSRISRISRWPSLTAAVVAKPLKSFWFTSAPTLCNLRKIPILCKLQSKRWHNTIPSIYYFLHFNFLTIFTKVKKKRSNLVH